MDCNVVTNIKDISCDVQLNASGYEYVGHDIELHGFWVEKDGKKFFFNDLGNGYCHYVPDVPFKGTRQIDIRIDD